MREFRLTGEAAAALADHRVQGVSLVPGAACIELARAIERETSGSAAGAICDATFERPIVGSPNEVRIRVEARAHEDGTTDYLFYEQDAPLASAPAARLRVDRNHRAALDSAPARAVELAGYDAILGGEALYATLAANGNDYGPEFRRVASLWRSGARGVAEIVVSSRGALEANGVPPSLLDSLVQSLIALAADRGKTCVLRSIGRIEFAGREAPQSLWASARLGEAGADGSLTGDVEALDSAGRPCVRLSNVCLALGDRAAGGAATRLVVAGNFTVEPIEDALRFWAAHFDERVEIEFAPYNQVFPQLLDPSSALRRNRDGANVLLLRLEPWAAAERPAGLKADPALVERCFAGKPVHPLPPGLPVAHWNGYETDYLYKEIFEDRCYLRHGIRLPERATVLDIGANIGLFSLFVKSRCPRARVYAFEPAPAIYELLAANCAVYGRGDLHAVNAGVAASPGAATFTFYENSSAFSGFHADDASDGAAIRRIVRNTLSGATALDADSIERRVEELTNDRLQRSTHECRLTSVSAFLREQRIERVDLLKIDAEKSELDILRGIEDGDWPRIEQIVLEIHDPSAESLATVERLLAEKGFRCAVEHERLLEGSGLFNLYATRAGARTEATAPLYREALERNLEDFCTALATFRQESLAPVILCLCPPSPAAQADPLLGAALADAGERLLAEANAIPSVRAIGPASLLQPYLAGDLHDPHGHALGDIPYTPRGYAALGTAVYRVLHALRRPPFKAIVLDCDDTLWKGTVGEDGVHGIEISDAHRALQQRMVEQAASGMLICLCSKNHEADVLEVFDKRTDMVLRREHLAAWRINWSPKSTNLAALAAELNLGLDSFVFLDDNPIDCADVRSQCPGVLALQLPRDGAAIAGLLRHVWAFDRAEATVEDRNRTRMVRENAERDRFRGRSSSLKDFLEGLELRIDIAPAVEGDLARISQLTYRTNQFNFSTVRRSEEEIRRFLEHGRCLAVRVSDRFGDYGLVGVALYRSSGERCEIDTFLLSCRVLGRGVEHAMLARLAGEALAGGRQLLALEFRRSEKNAPAFEFLRSLEEHKAGADWVFPAAALAGLTYDPEKSATHADPLEEAKPARRPRSTARDPRPLEAIAENLAGLDRIVRAIDDFRGAAEPALAPGAGPEAALLAIWRRVLGRPRIGVNDNFFDAGGTSLKAVQVIAMIQKELQRDLSIVHLFEHPTVARLAATLGDGGASAPSPASTDATLRGLRRRAALAREVA